ncbi:Piwi domain-containing protein [Heracleum sosnowskyi]|uniref:Piwi domain-containing protein n=1 Tax=Heracleum sosnowskyi TaxID=360622 RepID=A0AAD8HFN2_9APIA|nr:Piwi domain-containing protein [Heracleum sosnowskyi]
MFSWSDTSSLQFHQILRWKTSSAVYAARCTLNKCPFRTETLKHYTGYSEVQLRDCAKPLLSRELINCGRSKGIIIECPFTLIEEEHQYRRAIPLIRVDKVFEQIEVKHPGPRHFILCVLPEKKNSDIYGPWKNKSLSDFGMATQCVSPTRINDHYLTNVLLKINSKLGGTNILLALEVVSRILMIKDTPTMILGMDVSHGYPGRSDAPSIAAVVGSHSRPLISRDRAAG